MESLFSPFTNIIVFILQFLVRTNRLEIENKREIVNELSFSFQNVCIIRGRIVQNTHSKHSSWIIHLIYQYQIYVIKDVWEAFQYRRGFNFVKLVTVDKEKSHELWMFVLVMRIKLFFRIRVKRVRKIIFLQKLRPYHKCFNSIQFV